MGTWGVGSFDNDHATEWLDRIEPTKVMQRIRGAFDDVLHESEYIEAPDAQVALAAVELLAAIAVHDYSRLPEEARELISMRERAVDGGMMALAVRTIDRIVGGSELQELWAGSRRASEWKDVVQELRGRLLSARIENVP